MHYRSIQDLNLAIIHGLNRIPPGTDLIVGVPRSGMLASTMLALHLNLPIADVEGFAQGKILQTGERLKKTAKPFSDYRRVMVLEDSVMFGGSIRQVRERLSGLHPDKEIIYAAVYARPDVTDLVDFYFEICPAPRVFEWNLMHHVVMNKTGMVIDGVLRRAPTAAELADPQLLTRFAREADLLIRPTQTVACLIASLPEEYRALTAAWLDRHGIRYDQLIMNPVAANSPRSAEFKSLLHRKNGWKLLIEPSVREAQRIAQLSGKPVFCMESRNIVNPGLASRVVHESRRTSDKVFNRLRRLAGLDAAESV